MPRAERDLPGGALILDTGLCYWRLKAMSSVSYSSSCIIAIIKTPRPPHSADADAELSMSDVTVTRLLQHHNSDSATSAAPWGGAARRYWRICPLFLAPSPRGIIIVFNPRDQLFVFIRCVDAPLVESGVLVHSRYQPPAWCVPDLAGPTGLEKMSGVRGLPE